MSLTASKAVQANQVMLGVSMRNLNVHKQLRGTANITGLPT